MKLHVRCLNVTRTLIALLFAVAIWTNPGAVSNICATIGTVMWLFLPYVVRFEEFIINKLGGK